MEEYVLCFGIKDEKHCEDMPIDSCNQFPMSDNSKICKLDSERKQCVVVETTSETKKSPSKTNKASFINRISLIINIFILLL